MQVQRKLASIKRIDSISSIVNADNLECAKVGGWNVVIPKNTYTEGELIAFIEIDSFVPNAVAPFLTKQGNEPKEYLGIKGERIRTIKLRGVISQGLIIKAPEGAFYDQETGLIQEYKEGLDLTAFYGIKKWESEDISEKNPEAKGLFPCFIPKTDQERIQNLTEKLEEWKAQNLRWEVTEKLDGTSCTVYYKDGKIGVCSRNLELKYNEEALGVYWGTVKQYNIDKALEAYCKLYDKEIAIQGEIIGQKVQGNPYMLDTRKFFMFSAYYIKSQEYLNPVDARVLHFTLKGEYNASMDYAPLVEYFMGQKVPTDLSSFSVQDLIESSQGVSRVNPEAPHNILKEGHVFKSLTTQDSFKVISSSWLLQHGD